MILEGLTMIIFSYMTGPDHVGRQKEKDPRQSMSKLTI